MIPLDHQLYIADHRMMMFSLHPNKLQRGVDADS